MLPHLYMRSAEKFLPENPAVGQFQFGLPGQNATPPSVAGFIHEHLIERE